jgi:two-component system sensor histidine kinase BaeS
MKLGIHSKLFFAILLTTIIVVIGMMLFTRWSIHSGFVAFVEDRQATRITRISGHLLDSYEINNSWDQLARNKQQWLYILFGRKDLRAPRRFNNDIDRPERHGPGGPRAPHRRFMRETGSHWPPDRTIRHLKHNDLRLPFESRLMLFDHNLEPVYARKDQLDNSQLFPLNNEDGKTVGYLALINGPSLTDTGQIQFLEKQHTGLIWIALGILALSALISLLLSRRLVQPVQSFRTAARQLASGDYTSRVKLHSSDELGALANDINALGESLQANEGARRQWVADIAHELRTPLSVLRGELEALQSGVRELDRSAIDSLHEDMLRLSRLVDDLYQLSMTDLGALSYRKEPVDIADILLNDIETMHPQFDEAKITIKDDVHAIHDLIIQADSQRISQLFRNLLKNSLRYTNQDGQLDISAYIENSELVLNFQDSDPGVPESDLDKLFDRLYRVHASRNRDTGGAGLGLAISQNIVLAHEGKISAFPSPLGGLWIQIRLPLTKSTI